ncbi:MAG: hypothetical protein ACR2QC_06280 [Gammaproteobacteria bacterium]
MTLEIIALCLTIAASAGGTCWFLGIRLGGLEVRITGLESDIRNIRADVHDIRSDIRSLNERFPGNKPGTA